MNNDTPQNPPPANAFSPGQSPAQRLLARLDGVRQSAIDRWLAPCPAHADRSPSLSIREMPDGTLLIKCFAGCGAADVVAAVGLTMRDLFVRKPQSNRPSQSGAQGNRSVPDALRAATFESLVRGQPVFCAPPQGFTADQGHLHELGMVLVASGASVVQLFDGERVVADWWADASERPRGAA